MNKTRRSSTGGPEREQAAPASMGAEGTKPSSAIAAEMESTRDGGGTSCVIVGVGASAGGLEAFTELLKPLPANPGMAFVLIPHLDPKHESAMTELTVPRCRLTPSCARSPPTAGPMRSVSSSPEPCRGKCALGRHARFGGEGLDGAPHCRFDHWAGSVEKPPQ